MASKCMVHGCDAPSVANDVCQKHYKRIVRHGTVENTRPKDWGSRERHPAYLNWCNLRRSHADAVDERWLKDFWCFVTDIPEKNGRQTASRIDKNEPWSKENFYWKDKKPASEETKEYMRDWHKRSRSINFEYYKNIFLKKNYGVTYEWYQNKLIEQNNVCAICAQPETAIIKGKVLALAVDHCHDTGKVRGLLCRACNNAIGALKHDEVILQRAIQYLRE